MDIFQLIIFFTGVVVLPLLFVRVITIELVKKRPFYAFFIASFFVFIGFIAAFFIFSSMLSIVMITFSSLLILPFVMKIIEPSEKRKKGAVNFYDWFKLSNFEAILKSYDRMIKFYIFLFFGMAAAYTFLFTVLGTEIIYTTFGHQLELFSPGEFSLSFYDIIENNLQILILSFTLSIFYGAGSIFILNYNASIVGVVYGMAFRAVVWQNPVVFNIILFIPHTVLEVLAYLLAAVAGGILAQRRDYRDAITMLTVAVVILLTAAYTEIIFLNAS